jgi:hypothetical protein
MATRVALGGVLAFGQHLQGRRHLGRNALQVGRKAGGRLQGAFELGGVDDPGQLRLTLAPGREVQHRAGVVAVHPHVVHGGARVGRDRVPHLQRLQQLHRPGVHRVGPHVALRRCAAGTEQRHAQALAGERERGGQAHGPGATHQDIMGRHAPDCRERPQATMCA